MALALFIAVEVDPRTARDPALVKKLVEVCPVNIFAEQPDGTLQIVEQNPDECTLCELCLEPVPPGAVTVTRLYGEREVLARR